MPITKTHSPLAEVLARWQTSSRIAPNLVDVRQLPGRAARHVDIPQDLDPRLVSALWARGVTRLYAHQGEALAQSAAGFDVVVATPTASGKSLCYHLPVFDALLRRPKARALYLFPTKALARDQVASVRELAEAARAPELGAAVYDGDTPGDHRRAARERARIVATNPDMLHAGILPHHAAWAAFFAGLEYVVVDELHMYRGLFGANVANVMRRLRRVAAFYGASPRFVATSATIANPGELGAQVLAQAPERVRVVSESGAPAGPRTFVVYNPPVIDSGIGLRASYLKQTKRLTRDLIDAGVNTLVFTRSRRAVEILVRYLRDDLDDSGDPDLDTEAAIRGYRGGYLPDRRRDVEEKLRKGETRCVVATSALELGIDVGGLDAVVISGWPGSRAAAWQRAGRAGRRGLPSLVVLVACSEPLDQYVAADPEYLFGEPPEHGRADPDNLAVLVPHMKCAAFELPFGAGDCFGPLAVDETREVLQVLARRGVLFEDKKRGGFHWVADAYPAQGVPLRGISDENFSVIDLAGGQVLAEVDYRDAAAQLHANAIYPLEGRLYQVERLDWTKHEAFVRAVAVDYTTEAMTYRKVRLLETLGEDERGAGTGEVHVVDRVVGFKKIKLHTHENIGYGEVNLPEFELHTRGLWLDPTVPAEAPAELGASWTDGVARAAWALHGVASLIVMSEPQDLGHALEEPEVGVGDAGDARLPRIYLFDHLTGGAGLADRLYDRRVELAGRAARLVAACPCTRGCPACVGAPAQHVVVPAAALARSADDGAGPGRRRGAGAGPGPGSGLLDVDAAPRAKRAAVRLLEALAARLGEGAAGDSAGGAADRGAEVVS
jgi:DEAD/DEAH box helicase domain-containing protein